MLKSWQYFEALLMNGSEYLKKVVNCELAKTLYADTESERTLACQVNGEISHSSVLALLPSV